MDILKELGALGFASRLKRLSERLMRDVSDIYRDLDVDFEARWFPILFALRRKSPMTVTELAQSLSLTHPAVNQLAGQMEKHGLVKSTKDKADERRRLLSLSKRGDSVAATLQPVWRAIGDETAGLLKDIDADLLDKLSRIEASLDKENMYDRVARHVDLNGRSGNRNAEEA